MNTQINSNAPVKCSKSIVVNASTNKVWNVLTNINNWSAWQKYVTSPVLKGPLAPHTTFTWKTGGATIHSTLHTVLPTSAFGWTGTSLGIYAIHNWTITEVNGATRISVEESMQGVLAVLFKGMFNKKLAADMQHWLDLLKAECER